MAIPATEIMDRISAIVFIVAGLFIWGVLLIFGDTLLPGKLIGFKIKLGLTINAHNYYYGASDVVKIEDNTSKMANEIQKYVDEFTDNANELIQKDQQEQRTTISKEDIGINQLERSIITRLKL
jgi:low affinity Fe/Cu permease